MVNNPSDQLSRWFTDSTTPAQFIILKLKSPSIVETIKFGKYIKAHVSDLKKFQIFGGSDENNLSLLLSS
jgi:muskelin